jgi:tRNA/tmRNA/rRNA uracil-C5-methylase (TrmA/RlmC/RlmD family)
VKRDPVDLRIESLAAGGDGVAHDAQGRVVFVPLSAPGDLVRVRVLQQRKRFARGEVLEVLEPGPSRTKPRCGAFGSCGGCAWQHLDYGAQVAAKSAIVADALSRLGGFELSDPVPITASPSAYGYRARARLVQDGVRLGYRMRRSHAVRVADECPILMPALEAVVARERPLASGGAEPTEWELAVGSNGSVRAHPLGAGSSTSAAVELEVGAETLRISHGVFAQANALLIPHLVEAIEREAAGDGASPVSLVELYAGAGLFTLPLSRLFDQVWAVEAHPGAVVDLRFNLARAQRENVEVCEGPVENVLPNLGIRAPDVLVLDPPRTGVSPEALESVQALDPRRIVYLSCDPATLARDLASLRDAGYRLGHIEAFDLFPQTPHVEALASLEKR